MASSLQRHEGSVVEIFTALDDDDALIRMDLSSYDAVWIQFLHALSDRDADWSQAEEDLLALETERCRAITALLKTTIADLVDIAFMLPADIERLLDTEAAIVNADLIANRLAISEHMSRLRIQDEQVRVRQKAVWDNRRHRWAALRHGRTMAVARASFMEDSWVNPVWRRTTMDELMAEQTRIYNSVCHLMMGLRSTRPPILSPAKVKQIQDEANSLLILSGDMCNRCLSALGSRLHQTKQEAADRIGRLQDDLRQLNAYDEAEIDLQVQSEIRCLVEAQTASAVVVIDQISAVLVHEEKMLHGRFAQAIQFYARAADAWAKGLKTLDQLELSTTESYMRRLDSYDDELRTLEDEVALVVDGLRHAPNEDILLTTFTSAKTILGPSGRIEMCHRSFDRDASEIAIGHVAHLEEALNAIVLDTSVLFDSTAKNDPLDQFALQVLSEDPAASEPKLSNESSSADVPDSVIEEAVVVVPVDGDGRPYANLYEFDVAIFAKSLSELHISFLEEWAVIGEAERARVSVQAKDRTEEVANILNKALRVLAPRIIRLEVEVVAVRSTELKANLDRFYRFWNRFDSVFTNGDTAFATCCETVEAALRDHDAEIAALQTHLTKATTMRCLQQYHNRAMALKKTFTSTINGKVETLIGVHEDLRSQLPSLSRQFMASCAVFGSEASAMATYHPDEIQRYAKEVSILTEAATGLVSDQSVRLERLQAKVKESMDHKALDDANHLAQSDLSVVLGVGQRFGAPKRRATARLLEEYHRGQTRLDELESQLTKLERLDPDAIEGDSAGDANTIIELLTSIRFIFEERGWVFGMIQGTMSPLDPVMPTPGAVADPSARAQIDSMLTWMQVVDKVEKACHGEMVKLCSDYYKKNAHRLSAPADPIPAATVQHLARERKQADDRLHVLRQQYRRLVVRYENARSSAAMVALGQIRRRILGELEDRLLPLETKAAAELAALHKSHAWLERCLRPGLTGPKLDQTKGAADEFLESTQNLFEQLRKDGSVAVSAIRRLLVDTLGHSALALVSLFDSSIRIDRIDLGDELNSQLILADKKRVDLRRLIIIAERDKTARSGTATAPESGKKGGKASAPVPPASGAAKTMVIPGPRSEAAGEIAEVVCQVTDLNYVVFECRDQIWSAIEDGMMGRVAMLDALCTRALATQEQWAVFWKRNLNQLMYEGHT